MASVEDGIAAQIRNIEAQYGRPLPEWFGLIAASGLTKHTEVVAMLKADYGMAHGAAHRVSPAIPAGCGSRCGCDLGNGLGPGYGFAG